MVHAISCGSGCTDSTAFNYNSSANTDDGTCEAVVSGCTDSTAFNYNSLANTDDGSCEAVVSGCTDSTAFNYNSLANTDDNSCTSSLAEAISSGGTVVVPGGDYSSICTNIKCNGCLC